MPGIHEFLDFYKRGRRIADCEDQRSLRGERCRTLHRNRRAGHAPLLSLGGHIRLRHEAARRSAEAREPCLIDAGKRHIGVRNNAGPLPYRFFSLFDHILRKEQGIRKRKVRRRVYDPLHHQIDAGGKLPIAEFLADAPKALCLDFLRLPKFYTHLSTPMMRYSSRKSKYSLSVCERSRKPASCRSL